MQIGYARVSSLDQDTRIQVAALSAAGVSVFWEEQKSGVKARPALEELLNLLQPGDCLMVYKVDRLARSLQDLLRIANRIEAVGASLQSLTEPIETATPVGRMLFQLLGAFAEFERNVIRERCQAGREAALARGVRFGQKRILDYAKVVRMRNAGISPREIAADGGVTRTAVVRALQKIDAGLVSV